MLPTLLLPHGDMADMRWWNSISTLDFRGILCTSENYATLYLGIEDNIVKTSRGCFHGVESSCACTRVPLESCQDSLYPLFSSWSWQRVLVELSHGSIASMDLQLDNLGSYGSPQIPSHVCRYFDIHLELMKFMQKNAFHILCHFYFCALDLYSWVWLYAFEPIFLVFFGIEFYLLLCLPLLVSTAYKWKQNSFSTFFFLSYNQHDAITHNLTQHEVVCPPLWANVSYDCSSIWVEFFPSKSKFEIANILLT